MCESVKPSISRLVLFSDFSAAQCGGDWYSYVCDISDVGKSLFVYGGHNGSPSYAVRKMVEEGRRNLRTVCNLYHFLSPQLYYPLFFLFYLVSSLSPSPLPPPSTSLLLPQLTGTLRHKETIAEECRNNYILQLEQTNAKRRQHYDSDMPQVFKV